MVRNPSVFWPLLLGLAGAWILIGSLRVRRELPDLAAARFPREES